MSNRLAGGELLNLLHDAVLIVMLATLAGAAINGHLLRQVLSGQGPGTDISSEGQPASELLPMPVSLVELKSLPTSGVVLLDARNRDLYLQGHLPAARSLPWGESETLLEHFRNEVPVDQSLVVYCSGYGCEDSFLLAQHLMAVGYADVRVFEGGLPEWQDAGLPVEEGQP